MEKLVLSIDFLRLPLFFCGIYLVSILLGMLTHIGSRFGEFMMDIFKSTFYGLLAWIIYAFYHVKGIGSIPIVDTFTFSLCCFECLSNISDIPKSFRIATSKEANKCAQCINFKK